MSVENVSVTGLGAKQGSAVLKVALTFANSDKTPAANVWSTLAVALREYPLRSDIPIEATILSGVLLDRMIPLNDIQSKGFSPREIAAIKEAKDQRLYVRGHACYRDISNNSHHLSFCFMYMGSGFAYCEGDWNFEDDRCPIAQFTASQPVIVHDVSPTTLNFNLTAPK